MYLVKQDVYANLKAIIHYFTNSMASVKNVKNYVFVIIKDVLAPLEL